MLVQGITRPDRVIGVSSATRRKLASLARSFVSNSLLNVFTSVLFSSKSPNFVRYFRARFDLKKQSTFGLTLKYSQNIQTSTDNDTP